MMPRRMESHGALPQYRYSVANILHVHVHDWPTLNLVVLQQFASFGGRKLEHGVLVNSTDSCRVWMMLFET